MGKKKDTAAKILTDALRPSAARLCIDSHGNHAIQRILLKLPYQYTQFIFDAVAASVEDVARHRHGCCVIQRCLDSRHSSARTHLVGRIVGKRRSTLSASQSSVRCASSPSRSSAPT